MEYVCFNQRGDNSTQNGCSLKLVDKFTYIESSVSSTETDINTDIPDPLSPLLPIVCRLRQVFKATSRILT